MKSANCLSLHSHSLTLAAPGSEVRHIRLVAERIQSLVSRPLKSFLLTVRSHFLCDENSVPLIQDFLLLDFQFLGE